MNEEKNVHQKKKSLYDSTQSLQNHNECAMCIAIALKTASENGDTDYFDAI